MAHVTIFGNGNMGTAIDELLTAEGTTVAHQEGGSAYNHRSGCRR
jgi:glycerol-3-phosphate dehydrogenase